jgi:drug/metabolite transporter (DMT)-like permease
LRAWLPAYLLLGTIWGFSFYFIKVCLGSFTPIGIAFSRITLGLLTLLVIAAVTRTPFPPRAIWPPLFIYAALATSIPWALFSLGETYVTSALAGIINGATPLMTLVMILLAFPEERPTLQRMLGLLLGFVGVMVVLGIWNPLGTSNLIGILCCVGAITCYGISYPFNRRHLTAKVDGPKVHPISLALGLLTFGTVQIAAILPFTGLLRAPMTAGALTGIAGLGILGSGVAYILSFIVVRNSDATTASTVTYLPPVIAVIAGAMLLSEHVTWNEPIGGILVIAGAAIAQGIISIPTMKRTSD